MRDSSPPQTQRARAALPQPSPCCPAQGQQQHTQASFLLEHTAGFFFLDFSGFCARRVHFTCPVPFLTLTVPAWGCHTHQNSPTHRLAAPTWLKLWLSRPKLRHQLKPFKNVGVQFHLIS